MRRLIYLFLLLLIVTAVIWPRPYFKPNWEEHFDAALARGDCDEVERLMTIGSNTEIPGFFTKFVEMEQREQCGHKRLEDNTNLTPEEIIESVRVADQPMTFLEDVLQTSVLSDFFRLYQLATTPDALTDIPLLFHRYRILSQCRQTSHEYFEGYPNYHYLRVALSNPDMSESEILAPLGIDRDFCARQLSALAKRMSAAPEFGELHESVIAIWQRLGPYSRRAPDTAYAYAIWKLRIDEIYQELEKKGANTDHLPMSGSTYPRCRPDEIEHPLHSLLCADSMMRTDVNPEYQHYAAAYDYYFTLLSERLGNNLLEIRGRALAVLPDECRDMLIQLEKTLSAQDAPNDPVSFFDAVHESGKCPRFPGENLRDNNSDEQAEPNSPSTEK